MSPRPRTSTSTPKGALVALIGLLAACSSDGPTRAAWHRHCGWVTLNCDRYCELAPRECGPELKRHSPWNCEVTANTCR